MELSSAARLPLWHFTKGSVTFTKSTRPLTPWFGRLTAHKNQFKKALAQRALIKTSSNASVWDEWRSFDGEKKKSNDSLCVCKLRLTTLNLSCVWMCVCLFSRVLKRDVKNVSAKKKEIVDGWWECVERQWRMFELNFKFVRNQTFLR